MDYDIFSKYYDLLTGDVDYANRAQYITELFIKYDKMPSLLLDVGCGTGGFSLEFARRGVEVIGVDPSSGMLNLAKQKAVEQGLDILFLNQSGEGLDLYGTVDGAVCCLDTVNHIVDKRVLQRFFNKISLFLETESLFIFDVNTLYKHKYILADNTFVFENDDVYCIWRNAFYSKGKITDICLDFFENKNGAYIRSTEEFSERVYSIEELTKMLGKAGMDIVDVFGENSFLPPKKNEERNIIIARKGKN